MICVPRRSEHSGRTEGKRPVNTGRRQGSRAFWNGGAEEIRTPDPHNAIVVLYQLSYDPNQKRAQSTEARRQVKTILPQFSDGRIRRAGFSR